ncbi:AcrR family transcriptional regulator [Flavobacterium endophyticum]|uniref:AcrR family transcriptional regulator n=1 Tax=Flavobacterium endophyticum TaxID=1540163 RepID=A0A495M410_9FLAO|nr:TetR/AcrR family transcriptional regulator [Flavobacterium endophyticum]RKS19039.1 AcrR family transcriptional regulator [Flavobacterium endophyticum]
MGIKERKEREKLEMKEIILKAATEMFLTQGYEKTSIRAIASKIEYSVGTIYLYFQDKTEILHYIMQQGFAQMNKDFEKLDTNDDIIFYLKRLGHIYIEFAFDNQEYYDLMFIIKKPLELINRKKEQWGSGLIAYDFLLSVMKRCVEQKRIRYEDPELASLAIWGYLHGIIALHIRDRCKMFEEVNMKDFFIRSFDTFVDSIAT